jgi:phosphatidate cytidylyltransferase
MPNLLLRILTAAVLLVVFGLALFVPVAQPFFPVQTLLLIAAAAWEWSRLVGWSGWRAWASGVLCAVCAAGLAAVLNFYWFLFNSSTFTMTEFRPWTWQWMWPFVAQLVCGSVACLLWIVGGAWLLWRGVARWPLLPRWLRWGIGMVMLIVAWAILITMYDLFEVKFLLSVLALVWAADIGGYVFGRALGGKLTGGRKLAPTISPGKSWEGALGGFIGVLIVGAVWVRFDASSYDPSLYSVLWHLGPIWFLVGLAFLTAMSIVGDLTESLVKRAAGAKDSSQLLPGHGGVLDRIDALLPTLPIAFTLTLLAH